MVSMCALKDVCSGHGQIDSISKGDFLVGYIFLTCGIEVIYDVTQWETFANLLRCLLETKLIMCMIQEVLNFLFD
ncbi:hypothetical protein SLEP1_g45171 [Rubroshorea leprosula]|uniref:Uncharacterized protein n=1 Tax=Rubroshorea leprosula TaxID=152421 RepID=A0AAV5LKQ2_9ROSI|nr:hypothetical protein SLEP1_g45171 [Rubroshorea leprosula]